MYQKGPPVFVGSRENMKMLLVIILVFLAIVLAIGIFGHLFYTVFPTL